MPAPTACMVPTLQVCFSAFVHRDVNWYHFLFSSEDDGMMAWNALESQTRLDHLWLWWLMAWSVVINETWGTRLCNVSCGVMDFDAEHHPWQSRALMRTEDMCPNQMQITWHLHQYYLAWSWYNVHMYMLCNNRRYLLRIPDDRKQATCTVITHHDGTYICSDHMHNCQWSTCNAKQIPCGCTALTDPCACLTKSFGSW